MHIGQVMDEGKGALRRRNNMNKVMEAQKIIIIIKVIIGNYNLC